MTDQAARLRALVEARLHAGEAAKRVPASSRWPQARAGVGKTNLSLNLGLAMVAADRSFGCLSGGYRFWLGECGRLVFGAARTNPC